MSITTISIYMQNIARRLGSAEVASYARIGRDRILRAEARMLAKAGIRPDEVEQMRVAKEFGALLGKYIEWLFASDETDVREPS